MLIRFFISVVIFFVSGVAGISQTVSELQDELLAAIAKSDDFDKKKTATIDSLRLLLRMSDASGSANNYSQYFELYRQFSILNYDSAYSYARKMQVAAQLQNDPALMASARVKMAFILLSSGLFKEADDTLSVVNKDLLTQVEKAEYFTVLARYYYDLADYVNDRVYSPAYILKGTGYIDSCIALFDPDSFEQVYYNGLKELKSGDKQSAVRDFQRLLGRRELTDHQVAVTASTLSDVYVQQGQNETAIPLLMKAAIADIKSSTKETAATLSLGNLLFKKGDFSNASVFIEKAVNDALFYGARQRKLQVSAILPLIEAEKLNIVEGEKTTLTAYAILATLTLLLLVSLIIIIFRQVRKLQAAKEAVTAAHEQQQLINMRLQEANKIKEEYIGYFFNGSSEFYTKVERFRASLEAKASERKIEEIRFLVNNFSLNREREELLDTFDRIFLRLFPNFAAEFNALLKAGEQVRLKEGELLNTDIRIFALIRMGIHDTDKIARILGYSINTINTYKSKIKNKSVVHNEEFEDRIMGIGAGRG